MKAEDLIYRLYKYYGVYNDNKLSEKINIPAGTISKWKQRNAIGAIKKNCIKLRIYDEIFDEFIEKTNNSNNINSESKAYQALFETAYNFAKINGTEDKLKQLLKDFI